MGEYRAVIMTAPGRKKAKEIAEALIGAGLAPCVNVLWPCLSVYVWKGKIEEEDEVLMIAKTRREDFQDLCSLVESMHPYDVPEIIALKLNELSRLYESYLEGFFKS